MSPRINTTNTSAEEVLVEQRPATAREPVPMMPTELQNVWQAHFQTQPSQRRVWPWIAITTMAAAVFVLVGIFQEPADPSSNLANDLLSYEVHDDQRSPMTQALLSYREQP
jgi:hypothetical protein